MDGTTYQGASFFYLVPVALFLPLILWGLWSFGLKDFFRTSEGEKRARQLAREQKEKTAHRRFEKAGELAPRPVNEPPRTVLSWIGRGVAYAAFAAVLGLFSAWPPYTFWADGNGQLKLSLSVPGDRKEACVKRTRDELAKLPPNMRTLMQCARERHPVAVRVKLDGKTVFDGMRAPAGLSADGSSSFYTKVPLPGGAHTVQATISLDGGKTTIHTLRRDLVVKDGAVVVVDYDAGKRVLILR